MSRVGGQRILNLYRSILRLHKGQLPAPMRELGDKYVKTEFKAHWSTKTTETQWKQFYDEWQRYFTMLKGKGDLGDNSGDLAPDLIDNMSNDQRIKLAELRQQARKFGDEMLEKQQ
eukprot:TRINITY_DN39383_c1_g2_i1.p5 TRINITY_DN39383_c1_g2~~TRINITY_DN39383_c1_g2_i1.p5  ORF type:complete len:116 (-),score=18.88 TRINITY_DN39383_c1_g2_i1:146-493(-)